MEKEKMFKMSFVSMGIYDVLLGLVFAFFYRSIYQALNIEWPNHPGYILVPALFLVSGGIGEFLIARNPTRNFDLVIVRTLMKASFAGTVFYCSFRYGVPTLYMIIATLSLAGIATNLLFFRWAKQSVPPFKTQSTL